MKSIEETVKNADPMFYKGWKIFPAISPSNRLRIFAEKDGQTVTYHQNSGNGYNIEAGLKYTQYKIDRLEEAREIQDAIGFLEADGRFSTAVQVLKDPEMFGF